MTRWTVTNEIMGAVFAAITIPAIAVVGIEGLRFVAAALLG